MNDGNENEISLLGLNDVSLTRIKELNISGRICRALML